MREKLTKYYQDLHQIPEEGFNEIKTQKYILEKLKQLHCTIYELVPTGIIAFFDYGSSQCIAFRCDMDALPINEETNFLYKSNHEGYMHACGHDGHMAILISMAEKLENIKCPKNICLIFQPSEEVYGGALKIINSKILTDLNVKEIYGLHLWPNLKKGIIASRNKIMMASSTEIDITVIGKEVHIANKDEGIDAIKVGYQLLNKIKEEDILFNCGKITTQGARNIVCGKIQLDCSLRSFSDIKRRFFLKELNTIAITLSEDTQANIYIDKKRYIPPLKNSLFLFEKHRHLIDEIIAPVFQAEDFSFYTEKFKCLFLLLGVGNTESLHSKKFSFDPNVLEKGLNVFLKIAITP